MIVTTAAIIFSFSEYIFKSSLFIHINQNIDPISIGVLICNLIAILSIILYAGTLYRFDRPNGHYINILIIGFFLYQVFGLVDIIFKIYGDLANFVNEAILFVNLIFLIMVLLKI